MSQSGYLGEVIDFEVNETDLASWHGIVHHTPGFSSSINYDSHGIPCS